MCFVIDRIRCIPIHWAMTSGNQLDQRTVLLSEVLFPIHIIQEK